MSNMNVNSAIKWILLVIVFNKMLVVINLGDVNIHSLTILEGRVCMVQKKVA